MQCARARDGGSRSRAGRRRGNSWNDARHYAGGTLTPTGPLAGWQDTRNLGVLSTPSVDQPAAGWQDRRHLTPTPIAESSRPAAGWQGTRNLAPLPGPATIVVSPTGFDWTDAGIGFSAAFGIMLLAGGLLLVARRHRKGSLAAV